MKKVTIWAHECEFGFYKEGFFMASHDGIGHSDKHNKNYGFINLCVENGVLVGLYGADLREEQILQAAADELFKEQCEFIGVKPPMSFKGNFVDALMWIYEEQKRLNEAT